MVLYPRLDGTICNEDECVLAFRGAYCTTTRTDAPGNRSNLIPFGALTSVKSPPLGERMMPRMAFVFAGPTFVMTTVCRTYRPTLTSPYDVAHPDTRNFPSPTTGGTAATVKLPSAVSS